MSVPIPSISEKIVPANPQHKPAIIGACQCFRLIFLGIVDKYRIVLIKIIATMAASGPINVKLAKISLILNGTSVKIKEGLIKLISEAAKLATIDEIAKAVMAFIEKCLKTVS